MRAGGTAAKRDSLATASSFARSPWLRAWLGKGRKARGRQHGLLAVQAAGEQADLAGPQRACNRVYAAPLRQANQASVLHPQQ